jgi:alpha-tubulin suppressor-like RCC1 family protein
VGRNDNGQLGQGHFCHELTPRINRTLSTREIKVVQTSCGLHHTVFVTKNHMLYSCGFNDNGQLGHSDTKSRNVPCLVSHASLMGNQVQYAVCGYYHSIVLLNNGDVYSFGRNDKGQLGIKTQNGVA